MRAKKIFLYVFFIAFTLGIAFYLLFTIGEKQLVDKTEDKKDKSAITEINNIEKTLKALSSNVNKLKSLFKTKSDTKKKND